MSANARDIYVPSSGPSNADIMIIGEAPGKDEEAQGAPFVGLAGQFQDRYLANVGIRRSGVFFSNLCKYRPSQGNKFELLLGTPELASGLVELKEEINTVKPNLIVAMGNWPLYHLTGMKAPTKDPEKQGKPGTGITKWRGSILPGTGPAEGFKVLATFHPSYVQRRDGFGWHPVWRLDLKRAKEEMRFPDIRYPVYEGLIDPPDIYDIAHEMSQAPLLTVDIETFGSTLACVGFADRIDRAMCVTFQGPTGWDVARGLLESSQPKNFQFAEFDINYLAWHYGWEVGGYALDECLGHDTYIASANLLPEFPRGLDFLVSIYTKFPFYKEERKEWKKDGNMASYWGYNLKDDIGEHMIALEQIKELKQLYG